MSTSTGQRALFSETAGPTVQRIEFWWADCGPRGRQVVRVEFDMPQGGAVIGVFTPGSGLNVNGWVDLKLIERVPDLKPQDDLISQVVKLNPGIDPEIIEAARAISDAADATERAVSRLEQITQRRGQTH